MKTCAKCGKNVSDSTPMCPNCNSMAFHTDSGLEGGFSELMMGLINKNPAVGCTVLAVLVLGMIVGFLWLTGII